MHQLIYTSEATLPFTDEMLRALLAQAQRRNEQAGLTGVLLYNDAHFVQVLEGGAAALDALYERLLRDLRHHDLVLLARGPIAARRFGVWAMSFHAVEPAQLARVRGYAAPAGLLGAPCGPLRAADELLLQVIGSFMHNPGVKL
jgi:hypothetical protein